MRLVAAAVLLAWSSVSAATVTIAQFPPNPGVLPGGGFQFTSNTTFGDPPPPRAWVNGVYGGVPGATVNQQLTVKGPAGNLPVTVARHASTAAIGKAAAVALKSVPFIATGVALWEAFDYFRIRPDGQGGLIEDPGVPPVPQVRYAGSSGSWHADPVTAALSVADPQGAAWTLTWGSGPNGAARVSVIGQMSCSGGPDIFYCGGKRWQWGDDPSNSLSPSPVIWSSAALGVNTVGCPASIDPFNPAYSVPEGSAPGPDGKCRTARYNHTPIGVDAAAAKWASSNPSDPGSVAEDVVQRGGQVEAEPAGVTGPASQQGQPSVTTTQNPDGSVTTTTKTPTWNYSYTNNSVTWSPTYVTTTVNSVTNQTTTTTETPAQGEYKPEEFCAKNPESLACMQLGDPPGGDIQKADIGVQVSPQSGWGADNAACPAPKVVPFFGSSIQIDNTLMCDFVSGIRFAVIGVCGIIGALIFLGGVRQ